MPIIDPSTDCKLLGIVRAFTGIEDSAVIVHGRPGCHSGVFTLQALTVPQKFVNIVYSGLREEDLTFGGEERLRKAILNTYRILKPKLIVIAVASAAGVMGDDVQGVVSSIKDEVKTEILILNACGYSGTEQQGYEEALEKLADFVEPAEHSEEDAVNIIGFRLDMPHSLGDLKEIIRIFKANGIKVNAVVSFCKFVDVRRLSRASLNVCLGGDGLFLCEVLWRRFKIPYIVVPYPYGIKNTIELIEKTCKKLNKNPNNKFIERECKYISDVLNRYYTYVEGMYGSLSAVVIGEGSRAPFFAKFLREELSVSTELVVARTDNYAKDALLQVDLVEPDRLKIEEILQDVDVDVIYGSSLERMLAYRKDAGLVRIFYPTIDEVIIYDRPVAGFRGVLTIVEKTLNALMRMQEFQEFRLFLERTYKQEIRSRA